MRTESLRVAVALALGMATVARAATITVNSTADAVVNDGDCALREAILAANSDTAVDACGAGSGPDVVVVPAGEFWLTGAANEDAGLTGDLDVTEDLELLGAGATASHIHPPAVTCPPGGEFCVPSQIDRAIDIDPAGAGISVRLSGVSVASSIFSQVDEGGAIRNRGTLKVADSGIFGAARTRGGAIFSPGSLRLERDSIGGLSRGSGGGISALGPLEVIDSAVTGFAPDSGGGISATGPVTLVNTTIFNSRGGGICGTGPMTLRNATISNNEGGGINADGTVELSNVTITENTGGGITAGSMVLRNTIVAGNLPADCIVASTTGNAYNIDGDGSCGLSGTDQPRVAPLLGGLINNGGSTSTHALLLGSPAIDMGSPAAPGSGGDACESTDQRGVGRPVGDRCDVGAFEGMDTITTTTQSTTTTSTTVPGCSPSPRLGCQTALGQRSRLVLKNVPADGIRNKLSWSWVGREPVPISDFGDPAADTTDYTLCLYDRGVLRQQATAPAGGTCRKAPCWKRTPSGFTYADPLLDPDGLKKIVLTAGAVAGKARITVKGKGANLGLALPLGAPVRVQLVHSGGAPSCWDATFSTSTGNHGDSFNARSDP